MNSNSQDEGLGQAPRTMQGLPTNEITSSITFSVILYFNVYFSFVFFVGNAALITEKLLHFRFESNLQEVLLLPCFIIWIVGEVSRFYFGYTGNLKERVPQMSAFLLITIFPQLPCVIFFAYFQELIFPFDGSTGIFMFLVLLVELVFGYVALHGLIKRQTAQFFRLCQEEEQDELKNGRGVLR